MTERVPMPAVSTATSTAPKASQRLEFKFLDGLRAVAALLVAVLHAYLFTGYRGDSARDLPAAFRSLEIIGGYSVAVFIVLSGFVLMLPIARAPSLALRGGAAGFIRRRARRLLPPYFAAMLLFYLLILAIPSLREERGTAWDSKIPLTWDGALAHALLVHNLRGEWVFQANGPAWSVATEWQIYLAMVLLILPVWRRWGALQAVAIAVLGGWAVHFLAPRFNVGHLWYVADFAFGMLAATAVARGYKVPRLGLMTTLTVVVSAVLLAAAPGLLVHQKWFFEVAFGVVVAAALCWTAQRQLAGQRDVVHRILETRALTWIGLWSYSLYLIHSPLLGFGNLLLLDLDLSTPERFLIQIAVTLPAAATVAYAFHVLIERRFMTSHQRITRTTAGASGS